MWGLDRSKVSKVSKIKVYEGFCQAGFHRGVPPPMVIYIYICFLPEHESLFIRSNSAHGPYALASGGVRCVNDDSPDENDNWEVDEVCVFCVLLTCMLYVLLFLGFVGR